MSELKKHLKLWFQASKRDLPWRKTRDPYAIWLSEVMLQQTQVEVVIPYYTRWLKAYPTLKSVAHEKEEVLVKMWEGLGYYSRVQRFHKACKIVEAEYQGKVPNTLKKLLSLPGVGAYTAGAILAFAYRQRAAAIDGNVERVITRLHAIQNPVGRTSTKKLIAGHVEALIQGQDPHIVTEALIELGATHCRKKASCPMCPIKNFCQSVQKGLVDKIPHKKTRLETIKLSKVAYILYHEGHILMEKPARTGVFGHLWKFPTLLCEADFDDNHRLFLSSFGDIACEDSEFSDQTHSYTRYQCTLKPFVARVNTMKPVENSEWVPIDTLPSLSCPSGHRDIKKEIFNYFAKKLHPIQCTTE